MSEDYINTIGGMLKKIASPEFKTDGWELVERSERGTEQADNPEPYFFWRKEYTQSEEDGLNKIKKNPDNINTGDRVEVILENGMTWEEAETGHSNNSPKIKQAIIASVNNDETFDINFVDAPEATNTVEKIRVRPVFFYWEELGYIIWQPLPFKRKDDYLISYVHPKKETHENTFGLIKKMTQLKKESEPDSGEKEEDEQFKMATSQGGIAAFIGLPAGIATAVALSSGASFATAFGFTVASIFSVAALSAGGIGLIVFAIGAITLHMRGKRRRALRKLYKKGQIEINKKRNSQGGGNLDLFKKYDKLFKENLEKDELTTIVENLKNEINGGNVSPRNSMLMNKKNQSNEPEYTLMDILTIFSELLKDTTLKNQNLSPYIVIIQTYFNQYLMGEGGWYNLREVLPEMKKKEGNSFLYKFIKNGMKISSLKSVIVDCKDDLEKKITENEGLNLGENCKTSLQMNGIFNMTPELERDLIEIANLFKVGITNTEENNGATLEFDINEFRAKVNADDGQHGGRRRKTQKKHKSKRKKRRKKRKSKKRKSKRTKRKTKRKRKSKSRRKKRTRRR